jgi:hypothetical protein
MNDLASRGYLNQGVSLHRLFRRGRAAWREHSMCLSRSASEKLLADSLLRKAQPRKAEGLSTGTDRMAIDETPLQRTVASKSPPPDDGDLLELLQPDEAEQVRSRPEAVSFCRTKAPTAFPFPPSRLCRSLSDCDGESLRWSMWLTWVSCCRERIMASGCHRLSQSRGTKRVRPVS